jgi:hypothetical protein
MMSDQLADYPSTLFNEARLRSQCFPMLKVHPATANKRLRGKA